MAIEPTPNVPDLEQRNTQTSKILIGIVIGMFLFGFASIPLYRIFCEVVDPGGSSWANGRTQDYAEVTVDRSRTVRVRMTANVNKQLPWEFAPRSPRVEIHPGERKKVIFDAKNFDTMGSITGKAVYDINPPEAGQYFKKIECFCFQEQELAAGEAAEMPLVFWFEPDMPADIREITIAYTFFNMDSSMERTIKARERAEADEP